MYKSIFEYYFYNFYFMFCSYYVASYHYYGYSSSLMNNFKIIILLFFVHYIFCSKKIFKTVESINSPILTKKLIWVNYGLLCFANFIFFINDNFALHQIIYRLLVYLNILILSCFLINKKFSVNFENIIKSISYSISQIHYKRTFVVGGGGFLLVLLACGYLEIVNHHYFFLQDDNYDQFLPTIIQACRDFFGKGLFPEINPYQFGGLPTSSVGVYSLTYPLTYLSYAISKYLFKNEFLTIEIFSIIHILIGYVLAYIAGRKCNLKPIFSVLYAVCYSLSGFLVATRSWYYMSSITAYAPLLIIIIQHAKSEKAFKFKHILFYGLAFGLLAHAGNIQMWIYLMAFYFVSVTILYMLKQINFKKLFDNFLVMLLSLTCATPIMYVTSSILKNITREYFYGRSTSLNNMTYIIPSYVYQYFKYLSQDFLEHIAQLYYSGTVALCFCIIFFALFVIGIFSKYKIDIKKIIVDNFYMFLGIFAYVMSLGKSMYLWSFFHSFGSLKMFSHPIKFIIFTNLFLILAGFIVAQRVIKTKKWETIIICLTLFFMSVHIVFLKQSFCTYKDNTYHNVKNVYSSDMDLQNYRVFPLVPFRYEDYEYASLTMGLNFPTIYKISSLDAYDNNFENRLAQNIHLYKFNEKFKSKPKDIDKYLNEYGVKYLFVYIDSSYIKSRMIKYIKNNFTMFKIFDKIIIFKSKNPKPLAFSSRNEYKPLPIELNSQGFRVDTSNLSPEDILTINMVWFPNYKLYADGKEIEFSHDNYNRIILKLKYKTNNVIAKYKTPWHKGIIMMLIELFIFIVLFGVRKRVLNE